MLYESIKKLVQYGINTGLTPETERIYTTNLLLDLFREDNYEDADVNSGDIVLEDVLRDLLDEAVRRGIIEDSIAYRDLFDTKLMNCLVPRPAQIQDQFWRKYEESPEAATDYYYKLSQDSDYIRRYRIKRDRKWTVDTKYGTLDITINLSKPEKDPKAIAAAGKAKSSSYPKCQLCMENEGYAGRPDHPARENHRIIPITIQGKKWGFQYSPYVYYNEHCIVFNGEHIPMKIDRNAFAKLFDFIKLFPHYFLGSNADLPIVGGSILSHDHFQGGNYTFAMAKAPVIEEFTVKGYEDVSAGIVKWPLSVIRLRGEDTERIIDLADHIVVIEKQQDGNHRQEGRQHPQVRVDPLHHHILNAGKFAEKAIPSGNGWNDQQRHRYTEPLALIQEDHTVQPIDNLPGESHIEQNFNERLKGRKTDSGGKQYIASDHHNSCRDKFRNFHIDVRPHPFFLCSIRSHTTHSLLFSTFNVTPYTSVHKLFVLNGHVWC